MGYSQLSTFNRCASDIVMPTELGFPVVERRIADSVFPAQPGYLHSRFGFLQDADHLFVRESPASQGQTLHQFRTNLG
jgi:hypothetical protein